MTSAREGLEYTIEPWSGGLKDLRDSFDCGVDDLNSWLKGKSEGSDLHN